jgi:hypothetical protein
LPGLWYLGKYTPKKEGGIMEERLTPEHLVFSNRIFNLKVSTLNSGVGLVEYQVDFEGEETQDKRNILTIPERKPKSSLITKEMVGFRALVDYKSQKPIANTSIKIESFDPVWGEKKSDHASVIALNETFKGWIARFPTQEIPLIDIFVSNFLNESCISRALNILEFLQCIEKNKTSYKILPAISGKIENALKWLG